MRDRSAEVLDLWLAEVLRGPGLTALRDEGAARAMLLEDALRVAPLVAREAGAIVDVGSGGGTPGIPLAVALPGREVTLLEADGRKCAFLHTWETRLANVTVVQGRAEDQPLEAFGVALAKALAHPPTTAEWCLPLVHEGGAVLLWVGPTADLDALARAAHQVAGRLDEVRDGIAVVRKVGPTPPRFPRRAGMAKKRPLA